MTEPEVTTSETVVVRTIPSASSTDDTAGGRISRLMATGEVESGSMFAPTAVERSKERRQAIARGIFMVMALLLVIPVVSILIYLVVKAWPVLSWSFIVQNPANRMTAGGVWAPLVGTFCLVLMSLLIAAPIGVLAGVYLNEYTGDNWLRRVIS